MYRWQEFSSQIHISTVSIYGTLNVSKANSKSPLASATAGGCCAPLLTLDGLQHSILWLYVIHIEYTSFLGTTKVDLY